MKANKEPDILEFKEYALHESSLSRIFQHTKEKTIGMMTAFRKGYSREENLNRNKQLKSLIRSAGFGFINVEGHYIEDAGTTQAQKVIENSFLVISDKDDNGKLKGFLKIFGKRFDQDSVLYKEAESKAVLIGTNSAAWPGLNKEVVVGDWRANKIGDFYSKMRGHRTFAFESVEVESNNFTLAYKTKDTL
jgi:hypothetical protein